MYTLAGVWYHRTQKIKQRTGGIRVLSNQLLHRAVQDVKRIGNVECAVWDKKGVCLVMTSEKMTAWESAAAEFGQEEVDELVREGVSFYLIREDDEPVYVLGVEGEGTEAILAGRFGASQISNLLIAYKDRMDKNRFIQNLILDNLLVVDVYNQAKKMKIPVELKRVVFLIESKNEGETMILETMRGLYATGMRDFVTAVDERHVILVKALEVTDDYTSLNHIAHEITDTLNMEAMVGVRVAYGTIVEELKDVSRSYKEADLALQVGRVFYVEKNILAYNELGIGRLIHQLPPSLCEMFLKEVFEHGAEERFEDEELATVYTFFDNNLNISETARKLFVHRNTLVYRLEKIQKKTGLDVRIFEDALTFKIAMMVADHMRDLRDKE